MKHSPSRIATALMLIMAVISGVNGTPTKPADVKNGTAKTDSSAKPKPENAIYPQINYLLPPQKDVQSRLKWTENDTKEWKDACGGGVLLSNQRQGETKYDFVDFSAGGDKKIFGLHTGFNIKTDADLSKASKCMQLTGKWLPKVQSNKDARVDILVHVQQKNLLLPTLEQLKQWINQVSNFGLEASDLQLTDSELKMMVENLLPNASKLKILILSKNPLTEKGAKELVPLLQKATKLTLLQLSSTRLKDAGVEEISKASSNLKNLDSLLLYNNGITDKGAKIIEETFMKDCPQMFVFLANNSITEQARKSLAEAMKGK